MTDYIERDIVPTLKNALENLPVTVLTGLRQSGKSTLLQRDAAFRERRYVTLDDLNVLEAAKRDPAGFVAETRAMTIDEAQRCPELWLAVKAEVDRDRRPGRFLLSGSANLSLLGATSESLAGRAVYLTLHPFSVREINGCTGEPAFLPRFFKSPFLPPSAGRPLSSSEVARGGMPPVGHVKDPLLWFRGYEQTYMERDLRQLAQVADLSAFRSLMQLAALRTGQILNVSSLGRDAKLSSPTAERYLSLLETAFLFRRVSPYWGNRASRLVKSPKLFASDSGLARHLAGIDDLESAPDSLRGAIWETFVAQNVASILEAGWPGARLHYWNVQGRHEVDFVIESGQNTLALEVKSAGRWKEGDLEGLKVFLKATPGCRAGILAYNGRESARLGDRLWAIPLKTCLS